MSMPCNDGGQSEFYANRETHEKLELALARNDELARLLCQSCALLEDEGALHELVEVSAWYIKHLKHDRERVALLMERLDLHELNASQLDELEKTIVNL